MSAATARAGGAYHRPMEFLRKLAAPAPPEDVVLSHPVAVSDLR